MSEVRLKLDFIQWLGDDMSIKVFSYLDDPRDLVRVAAVSRSWEDFVIENGLCKQLCLKKFPQVSGVVHSIEVDNVIEPTTNMLECYSKRDCLKRNHKIYALLAFGLTRMRNNCISQEYLASSTDDNRKESITNTMDPRDITQYGPSYWSSKGESNPSTPETLLYMLCSKICLVTEIHIQPFQAYFHDGFPTYSAEAVRFRFGCQRHLMEMDAKTTVIDYLTYTNHFLWTYTSPVFPMSQENKLQEFKLPKPVLCIGGFLLVELLGRVQKNQRDGLFYICISHVKVVGRSFSPMFRVKMQRFGRCSLKYFPHEHREENCDECWFIDDF